MTAAEAKAFVRTELPPLVMVVPAHKAGEERLAPTVQAAVALLGRQGPVAVVDLYRRFDQLEPEEDLRTIHAVGQTGLRGEAAWVVRVPGPRLEVHGRLDALLAGLAELTRTCDALRAEGRGVVLVGPPVVERDERFWVYAGMAGELTQHLVLCLDAHFCDLDPGRSLAALLRGAPGAVSGPSLAVVVPADFERWHGPCASVRDADMAIVLPQDEGDLLGPLAHFLGVVDLPAAHDVAGQDVVRAVLDARVAPLSEWDWKGAGAMDAGPPEARYREFRALTDRAAQLARIYGQHLADRHCAPSRSWVFSQILDCLPGEITAVLRPDGLRELAWAVLDIAQVVIAQAGLAGPDGAPARWGAAACRITEAVTEILLAAPEDVGLQEELVARAAFAGPVLELAVLRAVHEVVSQRRR